MLTELQYSILRKISSGEPPILSGTTYANQSKIQIQLGNEFLDRVAGKTVIDFGCGDGRDAIELARRGAAEVIGIDIREEVLSAARRNALAAGPCGTRCQFVVSSTSRLADSIVSIDAFEHFADPAEVLRVMNALLKPAGEVIFCFGPTWYHPLGGHLFSVFPWAHILFSEEALIRWRSALKTDGATCFGEVAGGLNQMTISRFERIVEDSPFRFASFETVPIRKLRLFHNRLTREFTTAVVRGRLVKRAAGPAVG
jgi:SAM-dependent methyltransferase